MLRLFSSIRKKLDFWTYLFRTSAPIAIFRQALLTRLFSHRLKKYKRNRDDFREFIKAADFSGDWFSANAQSWMMVFDKYDLPAKATKALEIGSWEGMSSCFILRTLSKAQLICVDTWAGADEHQEMDVLSDVEKRFDANTSPFKNRLTKFKGTSFSFFDSCVEKGQFDFVYIDGSHHCDDVMIDAIKGFEQLKVGGIMIFDDYLWRYYDRVTDNPAAAINLFLKMKNGCYEVLYVDWQVILKKTCDRA